MPSYPFETQLVVSGDPSHVVLTSAQVTIYDPADTSMATPLALTDLNGIPLANPLSVNQIGFLPAFQATVPQVMWSGAGFAGYLNSYRGVLDEAAAARISAASASAAAGTAAAAAQAAQAAAVAAATAPTDTLIDSRLAAAGAPSAWKANTSYALNQYLINPSGLLVRSKSAHNSGPTYTASNYAVAVDLLMPTVVTANYTLTSANADAAVEVNSSSAVTVTVPTAAASGLAVGSVVTIVQAGTGAVTVSPASGVTLRVATGAAAGTTVQWSQVRLRMRAADEWVLELPVSSATSGGGKVDWVNQNPTTLAWPARPTADPAVMVIWKGVEPFPAIVASGTAGMLNNVDIKFRIG